MSDDVNNTDPNSSVKPFAMLEHRLILLLCLLAAVHVFIFSATFPFFNVVDEQLHFDLVVRYSNGDIPRALDPPCAEALPFIAIYGTPEYLWPPEYFPNKRIAPPPWTLPINVIAQNLLDKKELWKTVVKNTEDAQPPLYYAVTGLWWRLGQWVGFDGGSLLYWTRFQNILAIIALVWLGYIGARTVFPENLFLKIGVPALIAFMPQTAFYSIQNDVFSPLCFGAAFILLVQLLREEAPGKRLGIATGLTLAATFLTKISNLPLLAVSAVILLLKTWHLLKIGKLRAAFPSLALLKLCAGLPILGWLAWTKYHFGDFTGTAAKIQFLGWTYKPLSEWWHHPIFMPQGLWTFISGLMATFWQGELLWDRKPLAWPVVNVLYTILSLGLIGWALINLRPRSATVTGPQRQTLWFGFWSCIATAVFLGFLSIIYDFHDCFYPSTAHPYFTSGRLMLGALIPFMLLFVYGLDRALSWTNNRWVRPLALAGLILFMLTTEIAIDWRIFPNPYNWFHM